MPTAVCVAAAQEACGVVSDDSLPVYRTMSTDGDIVSTLAHGVLVRINWSVMNADGSWCGISSIDPPVKLGFVHCIGLQRQILPEVAPAKASPQRPSGSQAPAAARRQREWALAASALFTEFSRQRHDTLAGVPLTEDQRVACKARMERWWNIHNREDLLKSLTWLENGGHRQEFAELGARASRLQQDELNRIVVTLSRDDANSLLVARRNYEKLGFRSLVGWDYARYIMLCRQGYTVGYLTEDEAWSRILPAARILQQTFSSWQDLGENYLIGREFWSLDQTLKDGRQMRDTYTKLLVDPVSPWNRIPWTLDLE
jgi:hypothetical protein